MSILLFSLLAALLFVLHAGVIVLILGPLIILQPTRKRPEWYAKFTSLLEPKDAGLPQETFTLTMPDGVRLHCWFVKRSTMAAGTILYLHGVGDCKIGGVPMARFLYSLGYNIFLYDSRQHGESGGTYCTYGYYEKNDVQVVIDHLLGRKDAEIGPIGVFGTSMGAAIAIQAAVLDPRIRAVVAEASFTSLRDVIVEYQRRIIKLPWHFLRNAAMARSQKVARFKGREVSPIDDVSRLRTPILFLHGTDDTFIRQDHSQRLYAEANEPKQLVIIDGADHNDIWTVGGKKYQDAISTFFSTHLTDTSPRS
ncbi:MAG: alpha/beta fold hydrolase [Bacteroidetes bacterium]|nr:alpha/beta fold hydrolase [Bacteroidota bacterium]